MIGALWTGISGLSSQQQALDNESNNISNVNTIGFKSSRISFADQMYQDRIGKGSKILDAEKLYTQGNLKLTGVNYDMALSGEGFFTVSNTRATGSTENFYTRAGNFRMGDNGTLQDSAGNEVQGWMMTAIDTAKDVTSTNPNVNVFTNDYTKLLSSKIIKHSTYVETITAKATDYTKTAKGDSETIFDGAGLKSKSSKVSDIEEAIKDYATWLQRLSEEPDGASATSTAQISNINFKTTKADSLIRSEGQQIYAFINGTKYSQNYISTTATDQWIKDFYVDAAANAPFGDAYLTDFGLPTSGTFSNPPSDANIGTLTSEQRDTFNVIASRIETYKGLANEISERVPGVVAYMSDEGGGTNNDVLELNDTLTPNSHDLYQMSKGIIQIKSLIPGQEFTISEVGERSGDTTVQGNYLTTIASQKGEGIGALNSSKDALAKLVTGKQRDVYTTTDLSLAKDGSVTKDFTYGITIYDKELGQNIPIPNDGATPPSALNIHINGATSIDDIVAAINDSSRTTFTSDNGNTSTVTNNLPDYIVAKNVNGNLVLETLDENYDVEFTGSMKIANDHTLDNGAANLTAVYTPLDKNSDYSGREGAGAEFIQLINKVDQTATKGSLQLRLDTLGISDSAFGDFSVDSTGLIMMKQDGADYAIGQVAIALFNNNRGLNPSGDNLLAKTNESGEPIYNLNNDKTAKVEGKTLELSTADLSESLVNLMVFQRAFEANAKSITTSDQLLNTLINLKR
ncbi:flagellar hook-basal body complex protein [Malaciobacter sp. WC5094]